MTRTPLPWPAERFVDADAVEQAIHDPRALVIDARSATRFSHGDPRLDPRPGHIPEARSAPWEHNLDPLTGRMRPRVSLHRRYAELGAEHANRIIAYCGSGVTACHDLLALELAGYHSTALFTGSWSAWAADAHRPAATGPEA